MSVSAQRLVAATDAPRMQWQRPEMIARTPRASTMTFVQAPVQMPSASIETLMPWGFSKRIRWPACDDEIFRWSTSLTSSKSTTVAVGGGKDRPRQSRSGAPSGKSGRYGRASSTARAKDRRASSRRKVAIP